MGANDKKRKCQLKTQFCSGELMARYTGMDKDDPVFDACGACIVIMRRRGLKMKQVSNDTPLTT